MDPFEPADDAPIPPAPPRAIPPAPPPAELIRPKVPHVPLTPMMDFFARRLEAMERELELEKEKARSAQSQIQQQESLRADVDSNLNSIKEQLRREKAERDAAEAKSHAQGRIDALEKRLDEMHQSWAALLKEAVTGKESGAQAIAASQTTLSKEQSVISQEQALLRTEVSSLTGAVARLMEQIGQWRTDTQAFTKLLPELRHLSQDIPDGARRFEGEVSSMLGQFATELRERMAAWQRQQETEAQRQADRLRELTRERETLLRSWEERDQLARLEQQKERASRESQVDERLGELAQQFIGIVKLQQDSAGETVRLREEIIRAVTMLNTPPKAKDKVIEGLELERADLLKALQDRTTALQKFLDERRGIEKTMGESLASLSRELDGEREKQRALAARFTDLEFENAKLNDRVKLQERSLLEKDERFAALAAERDELAKALLTEHERVRARLAEQSVGEESWRAKLAQMEERVTAEIQLRAKETTAVSELRAQLSVLADQLTKAVQEKDAVAGRFVDWDGERQKLLGAVRQKDETISMLNAAFQNMLKKS